MMIILNNTLYGQLFEYVLSVVIKQWYQYGVWTSTGLKITNYTFISNT